jgi:type VI secretion system protein ImpF
MEGYMMADRFSKTRLSPPLMHVFRSAHDAKDTKKVLDLRNEVGGRVTASSRRLRQRQVITEPALRHEVARDLDALLNTIALASTIDMSLVPLARNSIINFGIPDLTHRSIDETGVDDIPDDIKNAILNFEPRLVAASLQIERDKTVDTADLKVRFIVRAELSCHPVYVPVEFVADVVNTGKIIINRV